jgi:hypothetical protein
MMDKPRVTAQIALRLPDEMLKAIDERAEYVAASRNAWIVKALAWALEQPLRTVTKQERV